MIKIEAFLMSKKVVVPILMITANINATAPTLIKFKKYFKMVDFLIFGMRGFNNRTNKNEGKNIPVVAAIAPQKPFN